jgi:hypothetical protein
MAYQINKSKIMRKMSLSIVLFAMSAIAFSQALESVKVVIIPDSIMQMGQTNGRQQLLIAAPVVGKSIIIQSIDVRCKVLDRLYSPTESEANYRIGYQKGSYWYDIAVFRWDDLNAKGNTTFFNSAVIGQRLWEESQTDNAPVYIKFDKPMNFTTGSNRLTLYITYRILN